MRREEERKRRRGKGVHLFLLCPHYHPGGRYYNPDCTDEETEAQTWQAESAKELDRCWNVKDLPRRGGDS